MTPLEICRLKTDRADSGKPRIWFDRKTSRYWCAKHSDYIGFGETRLYAYRNWNSRTVRAKLDHVDIFNIMNSGSNELLPVRPWLGGINQKTIA